MATRAARTITDQRPHTLACDYRCSLGLCCGSAVPVDVDDEVGRREGLHVSRSASRCGRNERHRASCHEDLAALHRKHVTCGLSVPRSRPVLSYPAKPWSASGGRAELSIHLSIHHALLHDVQRDQTRRTPKLSRSDAIQGDSLRSTRPHSQTAGRRFDPCRGRNTHCRGRNTLPGAPRRTR